MKHFSLVLIAGVSALALASAAQAADLIIEEPVTPGIVETTTGNWDGVYIGAFGGWAGGTAEIVGAPDDWDISGWLVGAALGANFTLTDGIVAGVVGDIAWSDISDSNLGLDVSLDWVGSVRGRLGFDGGAFMPYITGGLAFASGTVDAAPPTESNTHIGWTAGAGVEFAATEDLSVDLLYRYSDYGTQTYFPGDTSFTTHQVTLGLNWQF